ncbi:uncharacterized protein LOC131941367 [Physella acuta]|uniref:uncharacterized protein LOC131941367 n=1 Tax=Physella acuta TaxID=109671 RepID=UPI0027DAFB15|nr:uncharacterized protein LOC131941367 [Physella acuta]
MTLNYDPIISQTFLEVTQAPTAGHLEFTHISSLTGAIILNCEAKLMQFMGNPPVTISIWEDEKQLSSIVNVKKLQYSLNSLSGTNYSCGLTGVALMCVPDGDTRLQRIILMSQDLKTQTTETYNSIDPYVILYGAQVIVCIAMVLWNISLLLEHIQIIISQQKIISIIKVDQELQKIAIDPNYHPVIPD